MPKIVSDLTVTKNCPRPDSAPLNSFHIRCEHLMLFILYSHFSIPSYETVHIVKHTPKEIYDLQIGNGNLVVAVNINILWTGAGAHQMISNQKILSG